MFLSLASLALAQTPAEFWQKPLKEGVEPAKATVVLVITAPETGTATSVIVRDSTNLPEQLGKFEPDGILTVEADKSTKANVLAALAELRKYGRGVVIIDGPWVGGDFEDPVLLTVDAKADDRKTGIRARDLLAQLDGGQEWVAVIAPTFAPGMTPSGESYIGLDADQWASFAPSTMNGYFLTSHADVGTPPSATCNVRFTHVLGNSVNAHYGSGHDLTFDELTKLAKREAGLTPACGFAPEARYTGNLAPPRVMLVGSGILPEPDAPVT
ncbi:hypothetical protein HYS28_02860, partial [Candidatus Uhrbacteria bacterium]|nr:hypothetical protein [Candidatus Uhrbacteria bacterium]